MEGLSKLSEIPSRIGRFSMQERSQAGIFFSSPHQTLESLPDFNGQTTYKFLCLCFGLGPAPSIFTKLLKVTIALL